MGFIIVDVLGYRAMVTRAETADPAEVSLPDDLDSSRAKLVYLCLAVYGESTADELCQRLEMDKGSALSVVSTLRKRGHIERENGRYVAV